VANDDSSAQLRERGIVLLKNLFLPSDLIALQAAATQCFEAIRSQLSVPDAYQFNPYSHSVLLSGLEHFGCGPAGLMAPLSSPTLCHLFSAAMQSDWICKMDHSWVRKKFAPLQSPSTRYHPQTWHQDGALGVHFPPTRTSIIPMTELLTCWIPLNACGLDSPGLEFVLGPQTELVHFTELGDADLRRRFTSQQFWAPQLDFGDALVFLNSVLHRTHTHPGMDRNRISVEYRIFPRSVFDL
jgi:hypothetical protein